MIVAFSAITALPHPEQRPVPIAAPVSMSICELIRLFRPMQQKQSANAEPGKNGLESRREAATTDSVAIVSVDAAAESVGIAVAGEKLHDAPEGNPEHENETLDANPFWGTAKTAVVPLCPAAMVSVAGDSVTETAGVPTDARLMV